MSRTRRYDISISCQHCGGTFLATRYDAKYCGANCRQQARREIGLMEKQADYINKALYHFTDRWAGAGKKTRLEALDELMKLKRVLDSMVASNDY